MIYYFSGSGNSRAVAKTLGLLLSRKVEPVGGTLNDCDGDIGFVLPVYSWGIPPHILQWLKQMNTVAKPQYLWAVLTYGDEAGLAHRMLIRVLRGRELPECVVFGLQMPNTYVLLPGFDTDLAAVADAKLQKAKKQLLQIADAIIAHADNNYASPVHIGSWAHFKTAVIYPLFKRFGIQTHRWHTITSLCTRCGACVRACPMDNISDSTDKNKFLYKQDTTTMAGYPKWGSNCASCLACYHACPHRAVAYGNITRKKHQWRYWFTHPDDLCR